MFLKRFAGLFLILTLAGLMAGAAAFAEPEAYTDFAVMTTTDMHGKCWDTDVLTGGRVTANMLRAATAAGQIRDEYGAENTLLIDNGDLFQGTPVSQVQLFDRVSGDSGEPLAMAVCLSAMDYDAFVLGNHEFNYPWSVMSDTYRWLEAQGVPVLAANVCYDGTDGEHEAGEGAFIPYIIKTVTVNGHVHRIGVLGLENCDCTRWDLPANYPGLRFSHPGNEARSMVEEANMYIPRMKAEGCEFIVVSMHFGVGTADDELVFGENSENQGARVVASRDDIDMLVLGHDHSSGYSNTYLPDAAGRRILVVNGGGQQMTKAVFRFSEDAEGALQWEILEAENLNLGDYDPDPALTALIAPYAARAAEAMEAPIGTVDGGWDESDDYYLSQTDSIDLVCAAMMEIPTLHLNELCVGAGPAALNVEGLDHTDVDMAVTTVIVSENYVVRPGGISMRDIYKLYRYANNLLIVPMTGRQILDVMEENASECMSCRVHGGEVYNYTKGDINTYLLFGGMNFVYDMAAPAGARVKIEGFSNGRAFDPDGVYLVAVNNFILGNEGCGLRIFGPDDAVWRQSGEDSQSIQDAIAEYISARTARGEAILPEAFTWHWSIEYLADPAAPESFEGEAAARMAARPEEEKRYVLFHEAEGVAMTGASTGGGLGGAVVEARGDTLIAPIPAEALILSVEYGEEGNLYIRDDNGMYLTGATGGGLTLTAGKAEGDLSLWELSPVPGGWRLKNVGSAREGSVFHHFELYGGEFTTYKLGALSLHVVNFYELTAEG